MKGWALAALLLTSSAVAQTDWPVEWQRCRAQAAPLARLACYDAIGASKAPAPASAHDAAPRSLIWRQIQAQEASRSGDSPLFMLGQLPDSDDLLLTRAALRGGTLAIGCNNAITRIWLRLDSPWVGDQVSASVDGEPAGNNWFVRDHGLLLEFGRGLPAIDELKHWSGQRELLLQASDGSSIRVDLSGMPEALQPLRQLCRW
ncbi:type VI secretion system-associated protein TagO [Plesiomonas shigelloides]|uniref:type VI secretion system-associated protein VasI n=1 Tax=Plesiomonas shigelloides TaxID=703 RepID=UPI001261592C|nr:type VI secretion system-associated protein VasI [Plesiomonas shigelloides]KAB7694048.1 type VI secretion system-associated protein TagO [Plesiomonas shigelloides]